MVISFTTHYILIALFALLCFLPALYNKFITKNNDSRTGLLCLLVILTLPINWYTPTVITVTNCNQYTKEIMIFPTNGYSMGKYNYIVNNSHSTLLLQYIAYGNADSSQIHNDALIKPGETHQAPFVHLDHLFESAPESVRSKSGGKVETQLTCYTMDDEE